MYKYCSEQGHSTFLESERSPDHKEQKENLQDAGDIKWWPRHGGFMGHPLPGTKNTFNPPYLISSLFCAPVDLGAQP